MCESVKWLKGENLEVVLDIWIGQKMQTKNETANDEVIEE